MTWLDYGKPPVRQHLEGKRLPDFTVLSDPGYVWPRATTEVYTAVDLLNVRVAEPFSYVYQLRPLCLLHTMLPWLLPLAKKLQCFF